MIWIHADHLTDSISAFTNPSKLRRLKPRNVQQWCDFSNCPSLRALVGRLRGFKMMLFEPWASNATRLWLATIFSDFMGRGPGYRRDGQKEVQRGPFGMKRNPSLVVASQLMHCSPPVWNQHLSPGPSSTALCLDTAHHRNSSTAPRIQDLHFFFLLLRHQ